MRFNKLHIFLGVISIVFLILSPSFAQAQQVCDKSLFVASQSDLPQQTEAYTPCGNYFNWSVDFNINSHPFGGDAIINPTVVGSDMNTSIDSFNRPLGHHQVTGANNTAVIPGQDYLRITAWSQSYPDVFSNIDFRVHYYDKPQQ